MTIKTIGIDLAKNVFQVHGVDERGYVVLPSRLGATNLNRPNEGTPTLFLRNAHSMQYFEP
jgi:transposase